MSHGTLDFAGPLALSPFGPGYRYNPPPGVDLDSSQALQHPNTGVALIAALDRAWRNDRSALSILLSRCIEDENPVINAASRHLIGQAGSPRLIVDLLEHDHKSLYVDQYWWNGVYTCHALFDSHFCWAVPIMLDIYIQVTRDGADRRELDGIPSDIGKMLIPLGSKNSLYSAFSQGDDIGLIRTALDLWRPLQAQHGLDTAILFGAPFDIRVVANALTKPGDQSATIVEVVARAIYEATTGNDCSNWFTSSHSPRRLQIAAEATRFLAEDAQRFKPGIRYFAGHPLLDPPDPRAKVWMEECLARLEARIAAVLIVVEDDDENVDFSEGREIFFYAELADSPANPTGTGWERIIAAGQDAQQGRFDRIVERIIEACELTAHDYHFDLYAAYLLADAAPSSQLRAILDRLRPRIFDVPQPRWQELLIMALAQSKIVWALREALEILLIFDIGKAEYETPWSHFQPALRPLSISEESAASYRPTAEVLRPRLAENLAVHPPDRAVFEGELLELGKLVDRLEVELVREPTHFGWMMLLHHILQTMTGIDLSPLWLDGAHIDPVGGQAVIAKLRATPLVQSHEPGTRYFFGHRIPD